MSILLEKKISGTTLKVISLDITEDNVDAIVNAANSELAHGGGVAGAIVRKGGYKIQEESNEIVTQNGPVKTGTAVITSGGNLKAKYVIHVVGPVWGEGEEHKKLKNAVESVLKLAQENNIKTFSIPAISCGIYGFPKKEGTKIIVSTIRKYIQNNPNVFKEIHFVGLGMEIPELFKEALENDC